MNVKFLLLKFVVIAGVVSSTGCGLAGTPDPSATPGSMATALPSPAAAPSNEPGLTVAFVKDGNIQLWSESTGQVRMMLNSGDVIAVAVSDDGQVIAFVRRSVVQLASDEWFEQSALWAIDQDGGHPRELVSAESLRQRLNAAGRDSTNIPQMEWIPGTHRLLFSGWKYLVQAEGESHAVPEGLYLVDADALTDLTLVSSGNNLRFVPSPDGAQVALMSPNSLGFINVDGSSQRPDVLTYAEVGLAAPLFPTGVWTQDSRAFVMTGSFERDASSNLALVIWRVPVDGSTPTSLAGISRTEPGSVTFSPDGRKVAFVQTTDTQPPEIAGWMITQLIPETGPLATPTRIDFEGFANVNWSPTGDAFTRNLRRLCPDAASDSDVCDVRIHFDGTLAALQWIDGNRILFLTRDPSVLFLGTMDFTGNMDGTTTPIVAWPLEDHVSSKSFTTATARQ
jgi:dipeptidyl aminopeptidase/acylaminoacyl peptidase